jgi:Fe-S oxidoreductase
MTAADITTGKPKTATRGPADERRDTREGSGRVEEAMRGFVKDFGRTAALYLESCIHCGMCAEACHFHEVTGDARYTPIWKVEPFKQAYKREYGPYAAFYRAFNLKAEVKGEQLQEWQHLLYDSCTVCGRCSLMCPMSIDIAGLIELARHGMARAGLAPTELASAAARDPDASAFRQLLARLSRENGIEIPLDRPKAQVLCTTTSMDMEHYPGAIVALARVMKHVGADWTFRSEGFDARNYGLLAGDEERQRELTMQLIDAAIACEATTLLVPECGHGYGAMRWMGAEQYGKPLPFRVLHVSEFLAENVRGGKLRMKRLGRSATFHDPCQVSRRGGATDAPREVLAALGADLRETFPTKGTNWCCGGGGGVVDVPGAASLRRKVFQLKMNQIDATAADVPVTTCSTCRRSFDDGGANVHWDKSMNSLLELVAANLNEA